MNWWAWIISGAILLIAEIAGVNAQFYLVIVGASAIAVGLAVAALPFLSDSVQWLGFAVLALVCLFSFRRRIYDRLHRNAPAVKTNPSGSVFDLPKPLAPGESCQAEHAGSYWTIRNDGEKPLDAGARVRVAGVDGLTLSVRADA